MQNTLFDILTEDYKQTGFNSIKTHLTRLLNTRQGALQHMPDYGLPDVAEIYQGLPYSIDDLASAVKNTIEKYEPRLHNVEVKTCREQNKNCILQLEISGTTSQNEHLEFATYFMSGGVAEICDNAA